MVKEERRVTKKEERLVSMEERMLADSQMGG
jgi:hypothetical protein